MSRSVNFWDSATFEDMERMRSLRVFGNANIGNLMLCNLQVGGRLSYGDEAIVLTHWYARTNLSKSDYEEALDRFGQQVIVVLTMGDRQIWHAPLSDLLRMWRWSGEPALPQILPRSMWPELVVPRQSISVHLNVFGDNYALMDNERSRTSRVWIHLEGLRLLDNESDDQDNIQKVMDLLTQPRHQLKSAEERVVDWVMGIAKDSPPDAYAQLMAVADGILEGRHR